MAASTAQSGSKPSKKRMIPVIERTDSPAPSTGSGMLDKATDSGDAYESPYIKELHKNIRNINKKITNASKADRSVPFIISIVARVPCFSILFRQPSLALLTVPRITSFTKRPPPILLLFSYFFEKSSPVRTGQPAIFLLTDSLAPPPALLPVRRGSFGGSSSSPAFATPCLDT
jgi:hypothetical protein